MNDEVKEILDRLNNIPMGELYACCLEDSECKIILDYITNLQEENKKLKFWLNDVVFDNNNNDVELPARYLKKIGYIDFDDEKQVYINRHNNEPFIQEEYKEKVFSLKDDELDDYTKQLEYKFKKVIEYCDNNMEFTPRLIDVKEILNGDEE